MENSKLVKQFDARIMSDAKDIQAAETTKKVLEKARQGPNPYIDVQDVRAQKKMLASQLKNSGLSARQAKRTAAATINGSMQTQQLAKSQTYGRSTAKNSKRFSQMVNSQLLNSQVSLPLSMNPSMNSSQLYKSYVKPRKLPKNAHVNKDIPTAYDNDPRQDKV